jgi:LuxR family transcriptional regulator, maltose regulon positive regulatory protein
MSSSTVLGGQVCELSAGSAELVVKRDRCNELEDPAGDPGSEAVQGTPTTVDSQVSRQPTCTPADLGAKHPTMVTNVATTGRGSMRAPSVPGTLVKRERLTSRLSDSRGVRVSTVVAPAGYGKSVLAAEWRTTAHARGRRFCFLALEPSDNDPMLMWTAILAAARELGASLDDGIESVLREELRESRGEMPRTFLVSVLGALEEVPQRGIVVLDDLHLVHAPVIREGLAFMVERLPPTIHLVLLSRTPLTDLSLHRLRVRDELRELTVGDLAFTAQEGEQFLSKASGIKLPSEIATELITRTDGWITGLRLAVFAIRDTEDPAAYVRDFAGGDHDISEFLLAEVLSRQPQELRTFLLETSILSSLSPDVCDFVTACEDSAVQLRRLESSGIFLIALDGNHDAYRYQGLFAEFLRAELSAVAPKRVVELHQAASRWHEEHGDPASAVDHALSANDYERATELIVSLVADLHRRGLDGTLRRWFQALPEDLVVKRAELAVKRAWMHAYEGAPLEALRWCERADRAANGSEDVVVESSCLRAHAHRMLGDLDEAVEWGQLARALLDRRDSDKRDSDAYPRLTMTDAVAEAHGLMGDPRAAIELLLDGLKRTRDGGNDLASVSVPGQLAALSSGISDLDGAERYAQQALVTSRRLGLENRPPTAEARVALGEVQWERNDLPEAERQFLAAIDATRRSRRIWMRARALFGLARCRMSQRSPGEALAILDTIRELYSWGEAPAFLAAQVAECQIRFRCSIDDADGARAWLRQLARVTSEPSIAGHLEGLVLLAEGGGGAAVQAMSETIDPAHDTTRRQIERTIVMARVADAAADRVGALDALAHAVELAEPQRFVRSLIEPNATLVARGIKALAAGIGSHDPPGPAYLRELERAARFEQGRVAVGINRSTQLQMTDPLSDAELAVIGFLPHDCTYAEIAASRSVSVNTVKSQLKSVYRRLGVSSRVAAIERCRELGLLPESGISPTRVMTPGAEQPIIPGWARSDTDDPAVRALGSN